MNYKRRLFFYFSLVLSLFTLIVVIYEQMREKHAQTAALQTKLNLYTYIAEADVNAPELPPNLRITCIDVTGKVTFDNGMDSLMGATNHLVRKEIVEAARKGVGIDIRTSETLLIPYYYYARKTNNGYIRVALPYNKTTKELLSPDKFFVVIVVVLFFVSLFFLWLIARRFGRDMVQLRENSFREEQQRIALKAEMTSSIAHELRTPVSAIRGYAETLMESGISPEKQAQFIERIYLASVRLSLLLQDVSLLTKIEAAPQTLLKEGVDVVEIVQEVETDLTEQIAQNGIEIKNLLPPTLPMEGNYTLLYSVFRNLLENAVKYGGKNISVELSLSHSDAGYYYFVISDTGVGVAEAALSRLFERFYRVSEGRSRESGGSGLGLAIVRHAVMYHGGEITAANRVGGGLELSFSIARK